LKIVCDSTALIGLAKIGNLGLLEKIFGEIFVPNAVFVEVVDRGKGRPGAKEVQDAKWIRKRTVKDNRTVDMLVAEMGRGEAEVLVLGKELNAGWLILDDERARNSAQSAEFHIIGLAGILLLAKQLGFISAVKPLLDELESKNFRLSIRIRKEILKKANEK
jgi:predicted nucleic acid-binding protein